MKDYLFLYHADYNAMPAATAEQIDAMSKRWMDWINSIADKNQLSERGNRLASTGKVLKSDYSITNGPYTEIKESIGGYSMIKAASYDIAIEIAKGCPILTVGGNVEIREISVM